MFGYGNYNELFLGIVGNYEKALVGYKQQQMDSTYNCSNYEWTFQDTWELWKDCLAIKNYGGTLLSK